VLILLRRSRTQKILLRRIPQPLFDYHFDRFAGVGAIKGPKISHDFELTAGQYPWRQDTNSPAQIGLCKRRSISRHGTDSIATNTVFSPLCVTGAPPAAVIQSLALSTRTQATGTTQSSATLPFPLHYERIHCGRPISRFYNVIEILVLRSGSVAGNGESPARGRTLRLFFFGGYGQFRIWPLHLRVRSQFFLGGLTVDLEGLAQHRWREDDLKFFSPTTSIDLLATYPRSVRERSLRPLISGNASLPLTRYLSCVLEDFPRMNHWRGFSDLDGTLKRNRALSTRR